MRPYTAAVVNSQTIMTSQLQPTSQAALPHVLAVDDDPTIRQLIVDYLGQNELRVTAVPDGQSM